MASDGEQNLYILWYLTSTLHAKTLTYLPYTCIIFVQVHFLCSSHSEIKALTAFWTEHCICIVYSGPVFSNLLFLPASLQTYQRSHTHSKKTSCVGSFHSVSGSKWVLTPLSIAKVPQDCSHICSLLWYIQGGFLLHVMLSWSLCVLYNSAYKSFKNPIT